jgi:hypothetical protein
MDDDKKEVVQLKKTLDAHCKRPFFLIGSSEADGYAGNEDRYRRA